MLIVQFVLGIFALEVSLNDFSCLMIKMHSIFRKARLILQIGLIYLLGISAAYAHASGGMLDSLFTDTVSGIITAPGRIIKVQGDLMFEMYTTRFPSEEDSKFDSYRRDYRVSSLSNQKVLFELVLRSKRMKAFTSDSLNIGDYNFDGYCDFFYSTITNGDVYLVYDSAKQTFIKESLLNKLSALTIDEKKKITTGIVTEFNKEISGMYPHRSVVSESTYYIFGTGMKYVKISKVKFNRNGEIRKRGSKVRFYTYEHQILTPLSRSHYNKALKQHSVD